MNDYETKIKAIEEREERIRNEKREECEKSKRINDMFTHCHWEDIKEFGKHEPECSDFSRNLYGDLLINIIELEITINEYRTFAELGQNKINSYNTNEKDLLSYGISKKQYFDCIDHLVEFEKNIK